MVVSPRSMLLLISVVLFVIAAVGYAPPRGSLVSAGLAFFAAAFLLPSA